MTYRFACLVGLSLFLPLTACMAECGCASCSEDAGDPAFIQRDLRNLKQIERLQAEHEKAVQAMDQELARIAAMQIGDAASISQTEKPEGTSHERNSMPAIREKNAVVQKSVTSPVIE